MVKKSKLLLPVPVYLEMLQIGNGVRDSEEESNAAFSRGTFLKRMPFPVPALPVKKRAGINSCVGGFGERTGVVFSWGLAVFSRGLSENDAVSRPGLPVKKCSGNDRSRFRSTN